jgi:hypothetical protein
VILIILTALLTMLNIYYSKIPEKYIVECYIAGFCLSIILPHMVILLNIMLLVLVNRGKD